METNIKCVTIGPILDGSGYSESIIQHMLALDSVGVDVVARSVKMTPKSYPVPKKIEEFLSRDLTNINCVVQYNLPSEFVYKGGVLNVGQFCYETNGFPHADWKFGLNLMDKILVSCNYQKDAIQNTCGPTVGEKTTVIPHPVDVTKFNKEWEPMFFDTTKNTVKFYTISEFNKRKNITALLVAYYTAFDHNDNVLLIIKTNLGDNTKELENFCDSLKRDLRRFKNPNYYPKIAVIPHRLKDEHINSLHCVGDVFVTSSHGEAICLPFVDAIGFGKPAIAPKHSSFLDYAFPGDYDLLVNSTESIAFGVNDSPEGLYTCDERWGKPDIVDLAQKLRYAYINIKDLTSEKRIKDRMDYVKGMFSYEIVGKTLKEALCKAK